MTASAPTRVRLHMEVHGRVQGVGFRYFVERNAHSLGLGGFVRNAADGSVVVEAEGDEASVKALRALLEKGPPAARVAEVRSSNLSPLDESDFRVAY